MPWKDAVQLTSEFRTQFDQAQRDKIRDLYAFHDFLFGALPAPHVNFKSRFEDAIFLSEYGEGILSRVNTSSYGKRDITMACAVVFFHHDFLLDVTKSNPDAALAMLGVELVSETLRLPNRFGRTLYDKFNALPDKGRIEYLESNDVDFLLRGTEQGNYQIGKFIAGPLGILKSEEDRYLYPIRRVPLWHCADPGCQYLHSVMLLAHKHPAYELATEIRKSAREAEGPSSEWDKVFGRMQRQSSESRGKDYYDISVLIAEGLSKAEQSILMIDALRGRCGNLLRAALKHLNDKGNHERMSPEDIAASLSQGRCLQLLMILKDSQLVELIDKAVFDRRIKIPATEIRKPRAGAPKLSRYDASSTLSVLGVRSNREQPLIFLSAAIWDEYEKLNQLPELVWRCQFGSTTPRLGLPIEYMKTRSARDAIRNLILSSKPITLAIAKKLELGLVDDEPEDQLIDRFLWKFGFNSARFDRKYQRLRIQLQQLRDEAANAPNRLSAEDRDLIRSKGVNAFVSMENFVEELIAFNVWLLGTDHFATRFIYKFEDATAQVARILGQSKIAGGATFFWNSQGGNTLGTLLVYARLAADWMLNLHKQDRSSLKKSLSDLPHFVDDPIRRFPFRHYELWADVETSELNGYAAQFNSIVMRLERSRLSEIRNGLDHFREEDKFPSIDNIIACERKLTEAIDAADLNRFIPKAFWLVQERSGEFGSKEYLLQDYNGRKLVINGPPIVSGIYVPLFSESWIVPYGNLLGFANSELILKLVEESSYSSIWNNYPTRRRYRASAEEESIVPAADSTEMQPVI